MALYLHPKHGVAPALGVCRICNADTNEVLLLGAKADTIMMQLYGHGYEDFGPHQVPSGICKTCEDVLKAGGVIIVAEDIKQYLRMSAEDVERLDRRIANKNGDVMDLKALAGKWTTIKKAFWYQDDEGNVRLRSPEEWS